MEGDLSSFTYKEVYQHVELFKLEPSELSRMAQYERLMLITASLCNLSSCQTGSNSGQHSIMPSP